MSRLSISVAVIAVLVAWLFVFAPDVILTLFAGVLLAIFLRGGGGWIADRIGIARGWGVGVFVLAVTLAGVGFWLWVAPSVSRQLSDLVEQVPEAFEGLRMRVEGLPWMERLLERLPPARLMADGGAMATTAVFATFGALGTFVLVLFIGLYGAADPERYRKGFISLVAPAGRAGAEKVVDNAVGTLRGWLTAQLIAMSVVGVLTWAGLWLLDIPLALVLGLIAGLLAFIPNIGPVLSAIPALLLAASQSWSSVVWVGAVYVLVQTLESYVVTPLVQLEKVSLPPLLVIGFQLLFGVLFGILGLMLATPAAALAMSLTRDVYVEAWLERPERPERDHPPRSQTSIVPGSGDGS
jgi:predicted PurR-regulated permease PerM